MIPSSILKVLNIFLSKDIPIFPIHSSINNGECTCGNTICDSVGKHPLLRRSWKTIATTDIRKIEQWYKNYNKKFGGINFAACTGRYNESTGKYLVVVDVDDQNHELLKLLPKTLICKTGRGGFHYLYWSTEKFTNNAGFIANKIDIRGENGYIVIPPSKHKSGQTYEVINDEEIKDLPQFIHEKLVEYSLLPKKLRKKIKEEESNKEDSTDTNHFSDVDEQKVNEWAYLSINQIREKLNNGEKIPIGIRNNICFKMLCSLRGKGIVLSERLYEELHMCRENMEEPETFQQKEMTKLVVSAMKYTAYNQDYNLITRNYIAFLKKTGKPVRMGLEGSLNAIDNDFFCMVKPSNDGTLMSLEDVIKIRNGYFIDNGYSEFPKFKMQLLAKKLRDMGFERVRTAKANYWKINIKLDSIDSSEHTIPCNNNNGEVLTMTTPATKNKKYNTHTVEVDRKEHPNTWKYSGRSGYEYKMALLKYLGSLNKEEVAGWKTGTLILNEDKVNQLFNDIQNEDVIGVNEYLYKVLNKDENVIKAERFTPEKDKFISCEITKCQIGFAIGLEFAEILYRDKKPYGVSVKEKFEVLIPKELEKKNKKQQKKEKKKDGV